LKTKKKEEEEEKEEKRRRRRKRRRRKNKKIMMMMWNNQWSYSEALYLLLHGKQKKSIKFPRLCPVVFRRKYAGSKMERWDVMKVRRLKGLLEYAAHNEFVMWAKFYDRKVA